MTIASLDAVNMSPSTKLAKIRKEVIFFSRKLTASTKKTINIFWELICFGVSSTLISFDRDYLKYYGGEK